MTRRTHTRRARAGRAAHWGLASTAASTTFAVSYAVQRLASHLAGEVVWSDVIAQEHVPFTWRCAVALLHAATAFVAVGLGVDEFRASWWLRWAPLLVPVAVLPLALAMVAVP